MNIYKVYIIYCIGQFIKTNIYIIILCTFLFVSNCPIYLLSWLLLRDTTDG